MNLLLISHGSFAKGAAETLKLLNGENTMVDYCCLQPDEDQMSFLKKLQNLNLESYDFICCDLKFGTPYNCCKLLEVPGEKLISGYNIPLILTLQTTKDKNVFLEEAKGAIIYDEN